jgi:hypothetical protein
VLFEFTKSKDACVDVHKSGLIVVIVAENGFDNVFELGIEDVNLIVSLIKNGVDQSGTTL